ncbi:hypothetical protein F8388_014544 [Cannabis sativa]|uniref:F-box protein n=1 Tax=Cannabis sativa TaxID=3483 RepID=A0A7J6FZ01_CANSA|nr:hypothetical protein F8388_014544 [Cannabis sativa]
MDSDWANLPCHLLELIFEKIEAKYSFSFACVCLSWRDIAMENRSKLIELNHHLVPKLLIPNESEANNLWSVYNLSSYRHISLESYLLLPSYDIPFIGSSEGWLATIQKDLKITLFKPLNNTITIFLPPLFDDYKHRDSFNRFITFTPNPISNPNDFITIVIFGPLLQVAYIRPLKDDSWTHVLDPSPFNKAFVIDDILYYKDAFYGVDFYTSGLVSFEIKYDDSSYEPSLKLVGGIQTNNRNNDDDVVFDKKYLVESYKGDLLQVQRYVYMETFRVTTCFDVFKWSFDRSNWEEISDLGDEALFVGDNSSVSVDTSLSSTKCQSNCIYFTDDNSVHSNTNNPSDMGVYNLETRSVRRFNIDTNLFTRMGGRASIWIVPNISIKNYK